MCPLDEASGCCGLLTDAYRLDWEQGQPTVKVELIKDMEVLLSSFIRKVCESLS